MVTSVTGTSVDNSMSASATGISAQSTHASAHLDGRKIGAIVGPILLLLILSVIFYLLFYRRRASWRWNVNPSDPGIGAPAEANDNDCINAEDSQQSGNLHSSEPEKPSGNLGGG